MRWGIEETGNEEEKTCGRSAEPRKKSSVHT